MTLKFRVWDKNFKRVCQVDFIDCQKQIATYHISELAIVTNPIKKIILMQSTGLKDKNGVEIYEGDIVKPVSFASWIGVVKYSSENAAYILDDHNNEFIRGENVYLSQFNEGLEIIGNIYESTYLIESIFDEQRRTKMFMNLPSRDVVKRLREEYPEGTRVRLISMQDPYAPQRGTEGTVQGVDDAGAIMVDWDNGSGLHILYEVDVCEKI